MAPDYSAMMYSLPQASPYNEILSTGLGPAASVSSMVFQPATYQPYQAYQPPLGVGSTTQIIPVQSALSGQRFVPISTVPVGSNIGFAPGK